MKAKRNVMSRSGRGPVDQRSALRPVLGPALTKGPLRTIFEAFRGHLSRPACSHVKQLAKQAGDRSDPGRTYVQAGFFYGLISVAVSRKPPRGSSVPKW